VNFLVTAIGSVSGEYVLSKLNDLGHRTIGCDIYDYKWLAYADLPDKFYQVHCAADEEEYIGDIEEICVKESIEGIIVLTDIEVDVFNKYRLRFEERGVKVCISPRDTITIVRDKKKLAHKVLKECNHIRVIPTCSMGDFLKESPEWEREAKSFVVKPADGRSSQGLHYFSDREEIEFFAKKRGSGSYIVQPYIDGDRIVADVVRHPLKHKVVVAIRKELLSTKNGCGISVLVYEDKALSKSCEALSEELEICGCVNFEFLLDHNRQYHLLECNPRFSAGVEFSALAGCDCVQRHIDCFWGSTISDYTLAHTMYIARKWQEIVTYTEERA